MPIRASRGMWGSLVMMTVSTVLIALLPAASGASQGKPIDLVRPTEPAPNDGSYAVIDAAGGVITYGGAGYQGDMLASSLSAPVVGAATNHAGGYWLVSSDGDVYAFGNASSYGSMADAFLKQPIVNMASTPNGRGYWLVGADGAVYPFGDALSYGSLAGVFLKQPIVGMAPTPNGEGYWLVDSGGGVFSFGDAQAFDPAGSSALDHPIVAIAATTEGQGLWTVNTNGTVFSFGDAKNLGSLGANPPASPISGMTVTPDGGGYWLVSRNDSVYAFGDALYRGGASSPMHPPLYPPSWSPAIPAGVAILSLPQGTEVAHSGGLRVAFLGDSLAWYEAFYTAGSDPGYQIYNGATPGCGATNGAGMETWTSPPVEESELPACADWSAQMQWTVQRSHPDVVVVQLGFWESQPRLWSGSYVNLSDPAYSAYIQKNLQLVVTIAHADGARVILNTAPYYGNGTPAWIVDDFNNLVQAVAAQYPSFVSASPVNSLLSPDGAYAQTLGGVVARTPDDIHLTSAGVQQILDPALGSMVTSLGAGIYNQGRPNT
jgi:lysophospholipase L1-like esterase